MRGFTKFALHLVPGLLVIGLVSFGRPCVAQEVDAPDGRGGSGSVVAPSAWLVLIAPVHKQIALKLYGFYIGELKTPVAQVDVPIRTTKFLTVTPSYMYYSVPASGLNKLPPQPGGFTDSYDEHQFRIDGTVAFAVRKFEISARNMYVRRFRPAPADDINRYRGRRLRSRIPSRFTAASGNRSPHTKPIYDERQWRVEQRSHLVRRHAATHEAGVRFSRPTCGNAATGSRDVHYVLFGLIVSTR